MVAKVVSGKSIRGILIYNEDKIEKGEAKLILASGFATDIDRLNFHQRLFRFEQLTRLNERTKTNALHISLNFHSDDKLYISSKVTTTFRSKLATKPIVQLLQTHPSDNTIFIIWASENFK